LKKFIPLETKLIHAQKCITAIKSKIDNTVENIQKRNYNLWKGFRVQWGRGGAVKK
jgi:hypothetical protein